MKEARCQDVKAQTEETHVNNSTDRERKEEPVKIGREKLYEGARVVERERRKEKKCKMSRWNTNIFTHRRFYTETLLGTHAFIHSNFFLADVQTLYTQTFLQTDAFTHKHLSKKTSKLPQMPIHVFILMDKPAVIIKHVGLSSEIKNVINNRRGITNS